MSTYRLCTLEEVRKYAPEVRGNVVFNGNKYWIVKNVGISTGEERIEFLAFNLGHKIANIAEVKLLSDEEMKQVRGLIDEDFSDKVSYLIRLGGSYTLDDLPIKELEEAVAMELIFSLWIMRRDTHARNREYVKNRIPIFFDHGTSFLREPTLLNIENFFQRSGEGHAGSWRVVEKSDRSITTAQAREKNVDFHYVNSLSKFEQAVDYLKKEFRNKVPSNWQQTVLSSNLTHYSPVEKIMEALESNLNTIDKRIERMNTVIFQNTKSN